MAANILSHTFSYSIVAGEQEPSTWMHHLERRS